MTQRKYSSEIVDGYDKAPSRSMLRAVGFQDEDFKKSVVGLASTWSMVTPCNMHINRLSRRSPKRGSILWLQKPLFSIRLLFLTVFLWERVGCAILWFPEK